MDGIQGAVLRVKLKLLNAGNARRREHAASYSRQLAGIEGVVLPTTAPDNEHVHHIFAIRLQKRDEVLRLLAEKGISGAIHYPIPVHLQEAYRFLGYRHGSFPVAEKCAEEFLSLPMYPELSQPQLASVAHSLEASISQLSPRECIA